MDHPFPVRITDFSTIHIEPLTKDIKEFGPNYTLTSGPTNGIFRSTAFLWSKYFWNFVLGVFFWFYITLIVIAVSVSLKLVEMPTCSVFCENP